MGISALLIRPTKRSSEAAIYLSLPVIIKFAEVIVGIICIGIAAYDLIINFESLAVRATTSVAGTEFSFFRDGLKALTNLVDSVIPAVNSKKLNHIFIDQMTCRVLLLSVSGILLILSLIQLTWFPASLFSGALKSRIVSGVIHHLIGFGMLLGASLFLRARIELIGTSFFNIDTMRIVVIIGLVNAGLYLLSTLLVLWSFVEDKMSEKNRASSTAMLHTSP